MLICRQIGFSINALGSSIYFGNYGEQELGIICAHFPFSPSRPALASTWSMMRSCRDRKTTTYEKGGWYSVPQLLKSQTALALWGGRFCSSESSWPFTLSQSKHHFLPNRLISQSYNEHKFVSHSSTWQQRMLFWRQYLLLLWELCDLQMTNKATIINCELGDKQQIISRLTPILTNKSNAQIHAGSPHTWQAQRHSFERFRWMNMRTWNCHHDRLLS